MDTSIALGGNSQDYDVNASHLCWKIILEMSTNKVEGMMVSRQERDIALKKWQMYQRGFSFEECLGCRNAWDWILD